MTATPNTNANAGLLAHAALKTAKESPVDRAIRLKAERELKAQAKTQPVAAEATDATPAKATTKRTAKAKPATLPVEVTERPATDSNAALAAKGKLSPETAAPTSAKPAATPELTPGQKAIAAIKAKAAERYNAIKDKKVTLLVKENPKKPGTACYGRFAKYQTGQTVAQALAAGVTRDDITWDLRHKFISLS